MEISSKEARGRGYEADEIARIELSEEGHLEATKLLKRIDQTFVNIPKPAITLSVAREIDECWTVTPKRAAELALEDPETDWREVSKEKVKAFQEYFSFSDAPGWRFYLPAFMSHYLRDFPHNGYNAVYQACLNREHIDELPKAEMEIVDAFVSLCQKYDFLG
ncbi:DUF6714 family protein [Ruficoccus sp. ZRK36]|uniref:DUF6714 family protein n=1 Tax=Ruficoccus sp. ZRK36 TaxID=2866311 RepID=UPI001C738289|nr:DUF6714 family protein [Ruficoccus sp. ZRK36]QYY36165.1 hypothetical protein K0V07_01540 [Ruficoccus sp. ZRK36]